jgi:hypothetical protein
MLGEVAVGLEYERHAVGIGPAAGQPVVDQQAVAEDVALDGVED